ncbi:MAG TPA: hypothetical protein VLW50_29200 [Streptosporangiaceae bacterium]|nr:hypothetical protein [Streptosporangiaceae bacterium]
MRFPTLRRLGISRAALGIRAAAFGLTLVTGVAIIAANPAPSVDVLAALAAFAGVLSAVATAWPWTGGTLALLAAAYAVASAPAGSPARLAGALGLGAALWVIHTLYALATTVPVRAGVERELFGIQARRLGVTLGVALPLAAVTVLLGEHGPGWLWLRAVGVLPALGIAAAPLLLLPRRR